MQSEMATSRLFSYHIDGRLRKVMYRINTNKLIHPHVLLSFTHALPRIFASELCRYRSVRKKCKEMCYYRSLGYFLWYELHQILHTTSI